MYVKLWLESIAAAVMVGLALFAWWTVAHLADTGAADFMSASAIGALTGAATCMAIFTVLKLIGTIRNEAGARKRYAKWVAQDRAKHQAQWDAEAEASLAASRRQFTSGLPKSKR